MEARGHIPEYVSWKVPVKGVGTTEKEVVGQIMEGTYEPGKA